MSDLGRAIRFYIGNLGFTERFRFSTDYAGVEYGDVQIHLTSRTGRNATGLGNVSIFCDTVDDYYREVLGKGAKCITALQDYPYGMRDFLIEDPDGNFINFGAESAGDPKIK